LRLRAGSGELARAHATLERGAQFLGRGLDSGAARTIVGPYRAKVIGNGLRELDRFLQLLVLAIAKTRGIALPEQERHTANLVARLRQALGTADPDRARLLALGRTRDCLFHCGGLVRRGDARGGAVMTIGWHAAGAGGSLLRVAVGERLDPSARELLDICLYYRALAARLLSEAGLAAPPISIRETPPLPGSGCATGAR